MNLTERLRRLPPAAFAAAAGLAAFCTYSAMYAFRKPFTAAAFEGGPVLLGLHYKSALVIAQVLGYMLSKFIGIKVVSEISGGRRAAALLALIGMAELALLGFALTPAPWNLIFLFLNGLPLGMVFGLVFSYVEGRRTTEVIGLVLCASFIFASALVKDAGRWLMGLGVSEFWMPFMTGLLFAVPLLLSVGLLGSLPPPSAEDEALRTRREPMTGAQRSAFFLRFAPGLVLQILVYMLLTAYRDFRDNFLADIWNDLRGAGHQVNFSATETWVSVAVLAVLMLLVLVRDNVKALMINHLAVFAGVCIAGLSTWAFGQGYLSDYAWILATGFGTYVAYIPFNSILFDRMIAAFRYVSNVGFLIYLADSFGYLGSVAVLIYKDFGAGGLSWSAFFIQASYALALLGGAGALLSAAYYLRKYRQEVSRPA